MLLILFILGGKPLFSWGLPTHARHTAECSDPGGLDVWRLGRPRRASIMVSGELEARCYSRGNHNSVALELRSRPDETGPNSRAL